MMFSSLRYPGELRPESQSKVRPDFIYNAEAVELQIYSPALQPSD